MHRLIQVKSEVPFGHQLFACLHQRDLYLNEVAKHNWMEIHYLAWETVRKQTNPFFQNGTGFEGYLVGRCGDPEEALEEILAINQHILDAIARLYRFEYGFRSRLMKSLIRQACDSKSIQIWSEYFGAELAILRARIVHNTQAQTFRSQTYRVVNLLPSIAYQETEHDVTQTYSIGSDSVYRREKFPVILNTLPASQQDAWLVAENIGEFGHPLVRQVLVHD